MLRNLAWFGAVAVLCGCTTIHDREAQAVVAPARNSDPVIVQGNVGELTDAVAQRYSDYGYQFSLLVAQGDDVLLQKAYGPGLTPDTVFNAASISKQFTATAIIKLASEGKLKLSDPIARFFPEAPNSFDAITIDQLLSHTSGMRDDYSFVQGFATREELVRHMFSQPLKSKPGEEWSYCNFCYSLLAIIVERASGKPFKQYMREELFDPAGLRNTGFRGDALWPLVQRPYSVGGTAAEYPREDRWGFGLGSTDVITSPADLFRWVQALRRDQIVAEPWRALLDQPLKDVVAGLRYGRGWWTREVELAGAQRLNIWHSGLEEVGYSALLNRYPQDGIVTIFLTNQAYEGEPLREAFNSAGGPSLLEKLIFGGEVHLPARVVPAEGLEKLAGVYRLDAASWVQVQAHPPFIDVIPHGQAAFDALLPENSGSKAPDALAAADQRTQTIFNDIQKGAIGALGQYRDADDPVPKELLRFDNFEVLGSTIIDRVQDDGSGEVVTFIRLRQDGADHYWRVHWDKKDAGAIYDGGAPILPRFRAIAVNEFANWQPFVRGAAYIRFSGQVLELGKVHAERTETPL